MSYSLLFILFLISLVCGHPSSFKPRNSKSFVKLDNETEELKTKQNDTVLRERKERLNVDKNDLKKVKLPARPRNSTRLNRHRFASNSTKVVYAKVFNDRKLNRLSNETASSGQKEIRARLLRKHRRRLPNVRFNSKNVKTVEQGSSKSNATSNKNSPNVTDESNNNTKNMKDKTIETFLSRQIEYNFTSLDNSAKYLDGFGLRRIKSDTSDSDLKKETDIRNITTLEKGKDFFLTDPSTADLESQHKRVSKKQINTRSGESQTETSVNNQQNGAGNDYESIEDKYYNYEEGGDDELAKGEDNDDYGNVADLIFDGQNLIEEDGLELLNGGSFSNEYGEVNLESFPSDALKILPNGEAGAYLADDPGDYENGEKGDELNRRDRSLSNANEDIVIERSHNSHGHFYNHANHRNNAADFSYPLYEEEFPPLNQPHLYSQYQQDAPADQHYEQTQNFNSEKHNRANNQGYPRGRPSPQNNHGLNGAHSDNSNQQGYPQRGSSNQRNKSKNNNGNNRPTNNGEIGYPSRESESPEIQQDYQGSSNQNHKDNQQQQGYPARGSRNRNRHQGQQTKGASDRNQHEGYPARGSENHNQQQGYPARSNGNQNQQQGYPERGNGNQNQQQGYPEKGNGNQNQQQGYPDSGNGNQNQGYPERGIGNQNRQQGYPKRGNENQNQHQGYPARGNGNQQQQEYPERGNGNHNQQQGYPERANGNHNQQQGYPERGNGNHNQQQGYPETVNGNHNQQQGYPERGNGNHNQQEVYPESGNGNHNQQQGYPERGNGNKDQQQGYPARGNGNQNQQQGYPTRESGNRNHQQGFPSIGSENQHQGQGYPANGSEDQEQHEGYPTRGSANGHFNSANNNSHRGSGTLQSYPRGNKANQNQQGYLERGQSNGYPRNNKQQDNTQENQQHFSNNDPGTSGGYPENNNQNQGISQEDYSDSGYPSGHPEIPFEYPQNGQQNQNHDEHGNNEFSNGNHEGDYESQENYPHEGEGKEYDKGGNGRQPLVQKHIYVHVAPPFDEDSKSTTPSPQPEKHYKIIFIKAPTPAPITPPSAAQPQKEEKTLVYVLVKKPEEQEQSATSPKPTTPSKPEVYFIRYRGRRNDTSQEEGHENGEEEQENGRGSYLPPRNSGRYERNDNVEDLIKNTDAADELRHHQGNINLEIPNYDSYLSLNNGYQRNFNGNDENVAEDSSFNADQTAKFLLGNYDDYPAI